MSFANKTFSFFKAICLALIAASLMTLFMLWLSGSQYGLIAGVGVFGTNMGESMKCTSFWSVMLIINAIFFVLTAGQAVFGLLCEKNTLVLPMSVIGFLMFFLALFQKLFIGEDSLHVGIGAWLMLFLSLLAFGAAILDNLSAGKKAVDFSDFGIFGIHLPEVKLPARGASRGAGRGGVRGGWTCPTCGAMLADNLRFCDRCGTQKPEPPRCPNCGKIYQSGEAFCANCGSKL
ncbi:MAG: zinc ribbon domain-containing protein [Oscillospiraceae bacterium]|nr:zinc ribbon domain-containing protein [Oscillospiraceae bacterium]